SSPTSALPRARTCGCAETTTACAARAPRFPATRPCRFLRDDGGIRRARGRRVRCPACSNLQAGRRECERRRAPRKLDAFREGIRADRPRNAVEVQRRAWLLRV